MANDTRSGQKIKDDENCFSKGRHTCGNGMTSLSTESPDTSSLRRSSRVTYLSKKNMTLESSSLKQNLTSEKPPSKKNMTQSTSSIHKSEHVEKETSTTPPVQRKRVRVENQTELTPLRRSERSKKLSSPGSSGSKKPDKSLSSSEMKQKKEKKEKSVKQLNMETKEVSSKTEERDEEPVKARKRIRNAHSYRALLKRNKNVKGKDHKKELNRMDESSQRYRGNCGGDSSMKVNKVRGITSDAEQAQVDCFTEENLQSPELNAGASGTLDDEIDLKRGQNVMPLKRKRNEVDKVSDASAVVASKETPVSQAATPSSPIRCPEIIGNKMQRVDSDSTKQEIMSACLPTLKEKMYGNLCDASIAEDRGELQVGMTTELAAKCKDGMQHNGFNVDIPACLDENTCFIRKHDRKLMCCNGKGCKRNCALCVKKKIESGVHSLSEVESIWDAKEVEVLDGNGLIRQKEYFVKYKGLAHVHNRWLPESQLLSEAPLLVKFNRKHQAAKWKQEWTLPHRLLQRRCLTSTEQHDEHFSVHAAEDSDCHYEWLVKWHGLGYEHATWELENASFINSPQGKSLIREYEDRLKRAKQASLSSIEKEQKLKSSFPVKLPHLSAGGSSGLDNHLECVNKLRECWHNRQNAIVFDEQDRIVKAVLFISSLLSDVTRPFLIISTSSVLHSWEDEISHRAPSADAVIYNGNIETRKIIRTSEFYEGGCMFQALLSSPEVVIEDLNVFECIEWEVIIIDECQRPMITSYFEQFKMLSTDMRLLLVSGQVKDKATEYRNMLSVLETHGDGGLNGSDDLMVNPKDIIGSLEERLSKYVAYRGKLDPSRFVEYWIPVPISDVQLEQYCATLLSNPLLFCSTLKQDLVGAFRDILISTRKCCDHPYLVDKSLQSLLIKDLPLAGYLDVGIKACGKLRLLDTMLTELKNQGSRVLILFQSIGGGRESGSTGDILDDFLRQRFGSDSYERVDGSVLDSRKKAAALQNFNSGSGMFVFLLETTCCRSSIKLSSIHAVIIFHSDWSPLNDLRALQRITLDSQLERMKVFRLYSFCTVEEKVLILAKQGKTPDGYMQNMRSSTSHVLLMWGASYLFNRLDQFHSGNIPASSSSNLLEESLQKDVALEFLTILTQTGEDNDTSEYNKILKVKQNQGIYSTTSPLFGESIVEGMDEQSPHVFWTKLLEGKRPRWKYYSGSSKGSRKRVQCLDGLQNKPEAQNDGVVKKHRKVANNCVDRSSIKPGPEEGKIVSRDKSSLKPGPEEAKIVSRDKFSLKSGPEEANIVSRDKSSLKPGPEEAKIVSRDEEGTKVHSDAIHWKCTSALTLGNNMSKTSRELSYSQKSLHLLLKIEMAKLCEVLQLREDVKVMVEKFLEYVMINHSVKREPRTILQAFEISLCWIAASLLRQKIGHGKSLELAKQHFHFSCNKEEASFVYSLLQCLKEDFKLSIKDASNYQSEVGLSQSETTEKVDDRSLGQVCSDKRSYFKVAEQGLFRIIRGIKKKYQKKTAKLSQMQLEQTEDINKRYEEEKEGLDRKKKTEAAVIRSCHGKMQTDRLKLLDIEYAKLLEELEHKREVQLKNLEALYVAAKDNVRERENRLVEGVNSWLQAEVSNKLSSNEFGNCVECLQSVEPCNAYDNQENDIPDSIHISESQNPDKLVNITLVSREGGVKSSLIQETMTDEVVACSNPLETAGPLRLNTEGDELDSIGSEGTSIAGLKEQLEAGSSSSNQENDLSLNPCSREQIRDGDVLSMPDGHIHLEVSCDVAEDCLLPVHSSDGQIHDGARFNPEGWFPEEAAKTVGSNNGLEDVVPVNGPSKNQNPDGATTSMPDREVLLWVPEAASSSNCIENFIVSPPAEEQIDTGILLAVSDEEVPFRVSENAYPNDGLDNVVSLNSSSIEQIPVGETSCVPSAEVLNVPESCPGEIVDNGNINEDNYEVYATTSENVNCNLHLHEQSLVCPPSVQTQTAIEDCPVPSNPVLQDVCSEPMASTGLQDGNAAASEMEIALQTEALPHPVDVVASNESNHGAGASPPVVSEVGHLPSSENCFANLFAQSPTVMVENRVELSNQALSEPVTSSAVNAPTDVDTRTGIVISCNINNTVQNAVPAASRLPQHMIHHDPLLNELERLRKSADEAIRIHEETKLKLKSDCGREIEEAITQIRRKYEIKHQEIETEFMLRRQELDANVSKVLMNKFVAVAFRSKWMDMKASSAGMQGDVFSSPIHQQLAQLLSQETAQRPPAFAGPSGPPVASMQTTAPPVVSLPNAGPAGSHNSAVPTAQAVAHSLALLASIPSRPPHISSRVSPVNHQFGRGIRAPAPHLQPFRPSTSTASTSLPPSPILPINPRPTSLPLSQHPHLAPMAAHNSGLHNRASGPEASGSVPSLPNPSSQSDMDSLMDFVDGGSRANESPPSSLPLPSDFGSTGPIVQTEFTLQNGTRADPIQTSVPADVVCLSDDD